MTFIITVYTREGIVMASDSRVTLNTEETTEEGQRILLASGMSDNNHKTFLAFDRIGISTYAQADIRGAPISGFIASFIKDREADDLTVTEFANAINEHFRTYDSIPDVGFQISGYEEIEGVLKPMVYSVAPFQNKVVHINPDNENGEIQGATWNGETDIITRLLKPVYTRNQNGRYTPIKQYEIPWSFFTLQDAIDFSVYAIRTTIDSVRFLPRPKTVGGPIDVLVINPSEAIWISQKELKRNE